MDWIGFGLIGFGWIGLDWVLLRTHPKGSLLWIPFAFALGWGMQHLSVLSLVLGLLQLLLARLLALGIASEASRICSCRHREVNLGVVVLA